MALAVIAIFAAVLAPASPAKRRQNGGHHVHVHKPRTHPPKQRPAYWGTWIGRQITGDEPPWNMGGVSVLERLLGKGMSLIALGSPFADCSSAPCEFFDFPTTAMDNVHAYGAIPFFNWSSQSLVSDQAASPIEMPEFQLADVIAGVYDGYIAQFAQAAARWGQPFFLRFDWEMNGNWFPWSEGVNGNQPGEYVAAWRHVHDIFASVGATNATWVWCPYVEVGHRFGSLKRLYPGNRYVDWTCMDGFNWANSPANPHRWQSFDSIFSSTYRTLTRKVAPKKPIVLAEFASAGAPKSKARWIRDMFKQLRTNYRRIRGLIWFDRIDRGTDWVLESSRQATRAFARGVRNPAFRGNGAAASATSPIRPPR